MLQVLILKQTHAHCLRKSNMYLKGIIALIYLQIHLMELRYWNTVKKKKLDTLVYHFEFQLPLFLLSFFLEESTDHPYLMRT